MMNRFAATLLLVSLALVTVGYLVTRTSTAVAHDNSDLNDLADKKERILAYARELHDNTYDGEDDDNDSDDDYDTSNLRGVRHSDDTLFHKHKNQVCHDPYGQDGDSDYEYIEIDYVSRKKCEKICLHFKECYGYEYSSFYERCEIWHGSPIYINTRHGYEVGTNCYVKHHHDDYEDPTCFYNGKVYDVGEGAYITTTEGFLVKEEYCTCIEDWQSNSASWSNCIEGLILCPVQCLVQTTRYSSA
jgi:hypothetical protein